MAKVTNQQILDAALDMFSQKGYSGTNMRELAESLGLVKSSLYKHYESKEALWDALIDQMEEYYSGRFRSAGNVPDVPASGEELLEMTMKMIDFTIHDSRIIKVRKLLTIEQYRNERAAALATAHFVNTPAGIFTSVFKAMMDNGVLKKDDPETLGFAYAIPVSAMIHLCDREPSMEEYAMNRIRSFAEHFIKTYTV